VTGGPAIHTALARGVRSRGLILVLLLVPGAALGCGKVCERVEPSFQLDIRSSSGVSSIEVTVDLDGERYERTFDLGGMLDDGSTSLVVNLDPALSRDFQAQVAVTAYSGDGATGGVIAAAQQPFTGTPDGCNLFEIELSPVGDPIDPCEESCSMSECNATCGGSCASCDFECSGASSCVTLCPDRNDCDVSCSGVGDCVTDCNNGSSCDIQCTSTARCIATCRRGSSCLLRCVASSECGFAICNGNATTCPDGSIACNRDCP
jgi:hypothetical protein